jgi:hypothetical protein
MTTGYSVRDLIKDWWPDHLGCLTSYGVGRKDQELGVVCGCGAVLGFPAQSDEFAGPSRPERQDPPVPDSGLWGNSGDGDSGAVPTAQGGGYDDPPWDTSDAASPMATEQPVDAIPDGVDALVPTGGAMPASAVVPTDPIESRLVAIDPTRIYTSTDIELQLVSIEARLEAGQLFQRVWEMRALAAKIAYTLAYEQAISESDAPSADRRKAEATLACREELEAKLTAETMAKAVADTMHNLRSMLSGYQSIARSIGASMSVGGMDLDNARERYART